MWYEPKTFNPNYLYTYTFMSHAYENDLAKEKNYHKTFPILPVNEINSEYPFLLSNAIPSFVSSSRIKQYGIENRFISPSSPQPLFIGLNRSKTSKYCQIPQTISPGQRVIVDTQHQGHLRANLGSFSCKFGVIDQGPIDKFCKLVIRPKAGSDSHWVQ